METKIKAHELHLSGLSYQKIAYELGISKTSAFNYVKEIKLTKLKENSKTVLNGSEAVMNERSERKVVKIENLNEEIIKKAVEIKFKEFTGDELLKKEFDCLEFTGKFFELIGKPSKVFYAIIWGLPKGGKSNLSIRFADYLQEYFGSVLYIAAEEGESFTLQEKFKDIGGSKMTLLENRNRDEIREYLLNRIFNFVFIDSINNAGIDSDFLELLKSENKNKSFIAIVQATKAGNFKGDQALTHNCDFIIEVVDGVASQKGRFQGTSEINIFNEPLYAKNKIEEIKVEMAETATIPEEEQKVKNNSLDIPIETESKEFHKPKRKLKKRINVNQENLKLALANLNKPKTNWRLFGMAATSVIVVNYFSKRKV